MAGRANNRARYKDKINGQSGNTFGWLNGYKMNIDIVRRRSFLASLMAGSCCLPLKCQQVAQPEPGQTYIPKQSDRPEPLAGDEPGFSSIFDGKTLTGWEGNPRYWRVADGAMVGEITPETVIKSNTFIIWRDGAPGDFELKSNIALRLVVTAESIIAA